VLWNLLSNAVKFTPTGGQVTVQLAEAGSSAQIMVCDTGKGIAADFLPYVFDSFYQADSATTRRFGGLGLGLAIVRRLVELHGGTVWAASEGEGTGATFWVRLPLLPKLAVAVVRDLPNISNLADLTGINILVVDDEADTREFVAVVLRQRGATVKTADSAAAALSVLQQFDLDVLLSDIGMPEQDGYSLVQQVNASAAQPGRVKAIALTAYAGDFNQKKALQAGFVQHITKPIQPEQLVRVIAALCT
jgi:CheY-like chemotaxis protein